MSTVVVMKKKRIPRPLFNPLIMAMAGASIMTTEERDRIRMIELSAMEEFRRGSATIDDWQLIANMCNICHILAKKGYGPEALPSIEKMQEHMSRLNKQYIEHGKMTITMAALDAMRDVYEYADLQRQSVSRGAYEKANREMLNRVEHHYANQRKKREVFEKESLNDN